MNDKLRKYLQIMSYFTLVMGFVLVFIFFRWIVKDYRPIEFKNIPFPVEQKTIKRGEHLSYTVEYCKNNDLTPSTTKSFVDGVIYMIPGDAQPYLKPGCHTVDYQVYIPRGLPTSEYRLVGTYSVQVNPIRKIDIHFETEVFEVIE